MFQIERTATLVVSTTGLETDTAIRFLSQTNTHTHTLPFSLQACRVPDCGFDAGDCGTDLWESLYSVVPRPNHTHLIPAGITAMFFNLTTYFTNGTISSAEHTPCPVLRTAVMAQTFKTLSLTFTRNTSHCISNITINGTSGSGGVVTVSHAHSHYCCNYRGLSLDQVWCVC